MANESNLKPFRKGDGRPRGSRPKGSKDRSTILRHWLEAKLTAENPLTGEIETLTAHDRIALALISKALTGDVMAIREIQDSLHGKIPDVSRSSGTTEVIFRWDAGQLGMIPRRELPEAIDGEVIDDDQ